TAPIRDGDLLTIKVKDPDGNRDSSAVEYASVVVKATDPSVGAPVVLLLPETSASSGVFAKTIEIGNQVQVTQAPTLGSLNATALDIHYSDALAADLSKNVDRVA